MVKTSMICSSFCWPRCAARTASAMVKLLTIRTAVLAAPNAGFMKLLVAAKASGYMLR